MVIHLSFLFHSRAFVCSYSLSCLFSYFPVSLCLSIFSFAFMWLLWSSGKQFWRYYRFVYWIHWFWLLYNWQFLSTFATLCKCKESEGKTCSHFLSSVDKGFHDLSVTYGGQSCSFDLWYGHVLLGLQTSDLVYRPTMLWLHAWKLPSNSSERQVFLGKLQTLHHQTFGSPWNAPTWGSGPVSFIGVMEGTLIHARPLSNGYWNSFCIFGKNWSILSSAPPLPVVTPLIVAFAPVPAAVPVAVSVTSAAASSATQVCLPTRPILRPNCVSGSSPVARLGLGRPGPIPGPVGCLVPIPWASWLPSRRLSASGFRQLSGSQPVPVWSRPHLRGVPSPSCFTHLVPRPVPGSVSRLVPVLSAVWFPVLSAAWFPGPVFHPLGFNCPFEVGTVIVQAVAGEFLLLFFA